MGISPSVCNHHTANNQRFDSRSINPRDDKVMNLQRLLHHKLSNVLESVKTDLSVDLTEDRASHVTKAVMHVTSVTLRLLFFSDYLMQ